MIQQVVLSNWRAYERLELDLDKPVTFIVAPNGVGKTSLVEAVKWGILGRAPTVERGRAVRVGTSEATVTLRIVVNESTLDVTRTLRPSGATTFSCQKDGAELAEPEYENFIRRSWSADPDLLATLLFGDAGTSATSSFPIRDHLADVFGITPLQRAAETLENHLKSLGREIKQLRAEGGVDPREMEAAQSRVAELRDATDQSAERVAELKKRVAELEQAERLAVAWDEFRSEQAAHAERLNHLVRQLREAVHADEADTTEPHLLADSAEAVATQELDSRRGALSEAQSQIASSGSASYLLREELDVCPTCLRPLTPEERARALQHHHAEEGDASESIQELRVEIDAAEQRLKHVREISRAIQSERAPTPPDGPDPGAKASEEAIAARDELLATTEAHGAALARFTDASNYVEDLRRQAEDNAAVVTAYREEAVVQIALDAMQELADKHLAERVQPLADEIARRWKLLFGREGLQLDVDGNIELAVAGEDLSLADMSGGERVVALFVTRVLVAASATHATTLWLDEPLEHLDPRRRAGVARTIVRAMEQEAFKQVVITTYEERLARQLSVTAPDLVAIAHVRADPMD